MATLTGRQANLLIMDDLGEFKPITGELTAYFEGPSLFERFVLQQNMLPWRAFYDRSPPTGPDSVATTTLFRGSQHDSPEIVVRNPPGASTLQFTVDGDFFDENTLPEETPTNPKVPQKEEKVMTHHEKNQAFFNMIACIMDVKSEEVLIEELYRTMGLNLDHGKHMAEGLNYSMQMQHEHVFQSSGLEAAIKHGRSDYYRIAYQMDNARSYMIRRLRTTIERMENAEAQEAKIIGKINEAKEKDLFKEIITLNNLYPFDPETGAWSLPDYVLRDHAADLSYMVDGLQIKMDVRMDDFYDAIRIVPKKELETVDGYFHPHVNGGHICWGEAEYPAKVFWEKQNYVALFQLIDTLLGTYNDASPYITLHTLIHGEENPACACCGEELEFDDYSTHEDGDPGCGDCLCWVGYKEENYWENEVVYSEEYGEYVLREDEVHVLCRRDNYGNYRTYVMQENDPRIHACDHCHDLIHERLIIDTDLGRTPYGKICQKCAGDLVTCERCEDYLLMEDAKELENKYYCEGCYEEKLETQETEEEDAA